MNVELPRFDHESKELFIDILASCGSIVTVIECKKAQDRSYVFLSPVGSETTAEVKTFAGWRRDGRYGKKAGA